MSNYLELTQLPDGTIVLRRSDDHEHPIVKIEFSGIESVSGNAIDFDDFFDSKQKSLRKKPITLH